MTTWAIIGAGDVAEIKSGPAFQKADRSELKAVMRRNPAKAEDFARRHGVPSWYSTVEDVLSREDINSIYIATPPSSHKDLAIRALEAGKDVYLEKPVCLTEAECREIQPVLESSGRKLVVAHYRRGLGAFLKVKELLDSGAIGTVQFVNIRVFQKEESEIMTVTEDHWRVNPEVSGGGLFHDIGPHQIDLMLYYFGEVREVRGYSTNRSAKNPADDFVAAHILFDSGIPLEGLWSFCIDDMNQGSDLCEIYGSEGVIRFSFFGDKVSLVRGSDEHIFSFDNPVNIQQPMIQKTVDYFQGLGPNPCSLEEGMKCMAILDAVTS
ncbi:Gfo/Idh/MocA family oxidoreductase [Oceanispirochaeta crateris]|uniref:Gfo/Idh/MocA family oxidoreductase n=2 Tax=Oceanispirochaeta crateris TaxID=2518645 RepID=A0A5C1QQL8_9SPIO|nr:Gfo/Idh/MocA family oxidoreductase [Oceanispirochaeta crateris]